VRDRERKEEEMVTQDPPFRTSDTVGNSKKEGRNEEKGRVKVKQRGHAWIRWGNKERER